MSAGSVETVPVHAAGATKPGAEDSVPIEPVEVPAPVEALEDGSGAVGVSGARPEIGGTGGVVRGRRGARP